MFYLVPGAAQAFSTRPDCCRDAEWQPHEKASGLFLFDKVREGVRLGHPEAASFERIFHARPNRDRAGENPLHQQISESAHGALIQDMQRASMKPGHRHDSDHDPLAQLVVR